MGRDKAALVRPSARGATTCSPRCGGEGFAQRGHQRWNGKICPRLFFNVLNRRFHFVISHLFIFFHASVRQSGVGRPVVPKARSAVPSVVMGLWMTQLRRLQPVSSIPSALYRSTETSFRLAGGLCKQVGLLNRRLPECLGSSTAARQRIDE